MNKIGKPLLFRASLLAALLATAFGAQAAGLGKLTVFSAIGQPLKAEVEVSATPDELRSLSAKLASHEAFKDAGIEFMPALSGLQMSVTHPKKGQTVLKLTTDRPLNEPFLHFLVELNWTAGRMVREYTFLLDPPEMLQAAKAASIVSPVAPVVTPLPAASVAKPAAVAPSVSRSPADSGSASPAASSGNQQLVVPGDTLGKIARENKPDAVSLDQMLVALFNSNRDAFIDNNMNRLRAGKILRLPDAEEVAKIDPAQAHKLVIGQAAEFNAYRRRLAAAAGAAPAVDTEPKQQASGLIKPRVEEKAPPAESKDKLEVSRTESAKSAKSGKAVGGANLEADLVAREKALREASERIGHLEKNIEGLKNLVEIKSQKGTQMQQESQAAQPAPAQLAPAEVKPPVPAPSTPSVESTAPTAPVAPAVPVPSDAAPAEKPVEVPPPAAAEPPPAPKPPVKKPVAPPPPSEAGFLEENPQLLYSGGALAALLLGYAAYAARRKKKASVEPVLADLATEMPAPAEAGKFAPVFGAPSETVDSGEISIQGDFSDGGMLTTEEKVDPVAEADVLMAYGRDRQAEEILLEGLRQDPQRTAIHMKLLELYAKQENLAQFEKVATELHDLTGGRGSDWDKTDALARKLGLAGGIFLGAGAITTSEAPVSPPPSPAEVQVAAVPESPAAVEPEVSSLDFDLDLGTTSAPAAAAEPEQPAPAEAPAPEEVMSLDFDFDLGSSESPAAPPQEAAPTQEASAAADGGIDFSLDLDSNATAGGVVQESVPAADASGVDGLDFDLDIGGGDAPATAGAAPEVAAPAPVTGETAVAAESAGMDIDFDLELGSGQEPAAAELPAAAEPEAATALDLADISLDLDTGATAPAEAVELPPLDLPEERLAAAPVAVPDEKPVAPVETMDLPDIELSLDTGEAAVPAVETAAPATSIPVETPSEPDNPEVTTKLELAQAYEEMGDREGARDLLNEVLSEGSAAQQAQARMRLDQLGI